VPITPEKEEEIIAALNEGFPGVYGRARSAV
jgi:hypothetical protein